MSDHLSEAALVIAISSRALFDLRKEDGIFNAEGLDAYRMYQLQYENEVLAPGAGFPLIKAILRLNKLMPETRKIEVLIMSRNSSETSLRIFHSIEQHQLDISRAALVGGASLAPYLQAYQVDLFLSCDEEDVQRGTNAGVASAYIYDNITDTTQDIAQIRIAFDGDSVLFSDESETIFQQQGMDAFVAHEQQYAKTPLAEGPFAKLLKTISLIQANTDIQPPPIRTALVTARNRLTHERVIRTLMAWGVQINEAHFLGGLRKADVLKAFQAHIFFDDQPMHCQYASKVVPTGRVLNKT